MNIKLSPKHGVNPALLKCFICGADAGLALLGQLKGDAEAPRQMTGPGHHCSTCEGVMKQGGIMLVETTDASDGSQDPDRTGRVWGMSDQWVKRALNPGFEHKGLAFITQATAKMLGLPDPPKEG